MSIDSGQAPADVEILFLKKASSLDTYGVDPHPVKVSVVTSSRYLINDVTCSKCLKQSGHRVTLVFALSIMTSRKVGERFDLHLKHFE